jgi:hypothetical protein
MRRHRRQIEKLTTRGCSHKKPFVRHHSIRRLGDFPNTGPLMAAFRTRDSLPEGKHRFPPAVTPFVSEPNLKFFLGNQRLVRLRPVRRAIRLLMSSRSVHSCSSFISKVDITILSRRCVSPILTERRTGLAQQSLSARRPTPRA